MTVVLTRTILAMALIGSMSSIAAAEDEKFGPGEVSCFDNNMCHLAIRGITSVIFFEFSTQFLPEAKKNSFLENCSNNKCIVTLTGTRKTLTGNTIIPSDIEWH